MQTDTWYILNRSTNRFVKASGKIGQKIANSPAAIPALLIDTNNQTIRVTTEAHNIEVKTVNQAKAIIKAYQRASTDYYVLRTKYAMPAI